MPLHIWVFTERIFRIDFISLKTTLPYIAAFTKFSCESIFLDEKLIDIAKTNFHIIFKNLQYLQKFVAISNLIKNGLMVLTKNLEHVKHKKATHLQFLFLNQHSLLDENLDQIFSIKYFGTQLTKLNSPFISIKPS